MKLITKLFLSIAAIAACSTARAQISDSLKTVSVELASARRQVSYKSRFTVDGVVDIHTAGAHCAALATDRGGVMLYQSTSGDASPGTSTLTMTGCTLRDNNGTGMFPITNTHSIVNMEDCRLLASDGKELTKSHALIVCRNCNQDGHNWGREGSNGGQVEFHLKNQPHTGTLLAAEQESSIRIDGDTKSLMASRITILSGKGQVNGIGQQ